MRWEPGSKYFTQCETHTVCRVSNGQEWIYELWDRRTKQRIGERRAKSAEDQRLAVSQLKGMVDEPALQVAV